MSTLELIPLPIIIARMSREYGLVMQKPRVYFSLRDTRVRAILGARQ